MVPRQAQDHLRAGRPNACLAVLERAVRDDPSCAATRLFLFQTQSLLGQWDRARTQLRILGDLDATRAMFYVMYDKVLAAEKFRTECLAGRSEPIVPGGEPPPGFAARLALARALTSDDQDLPAGDAAAATVDSQINGSDPAPSADVDDRFSEFLEAFVDGQYAWIPLVKIAQLDTQPPAQLHDLIWLPARIRLTDGTALQAFLPTRYPGTESADSSAVCLGHQTDFFQAAPGLQWGMGQRLLARGDQQIPLLEVRSASFARGPGEDATPQASSDAESPAAASLTDPQGQI
jgi:type VI secretion system protein ImpE